MPRKRDKRFEESRDAVQVLGVICDYHRRFETLQLKSRLMMALLSEGMGTLNECPFCSTPRATGVHTSDCWFRRVKTVYEEKEEI